MSNVASGEVVSGDTGIYDGYVTIFSGIGEYAKIISFILCAEGTDDDKKITLDECKEMIGYTGHPIHVIFEDSLSGEIFIYGNTRNKVWQRAGTTIGYA